jgi:hypothetical protein
MNADNLEEILKTIGAEDVPADVHRIAQETSNNFSRSLERPIQPKQPIIWEYIMRSRITKLAAAAAALIIVALAGWFSMNPDSPPQVSSFTLLSSASAAEQRLFCVPGGIAHIANEIILYPRSEPDTGELLGELESDVTQDRNIAFLKSWLSYRWIPVYLIGPDGQPHEHKLELARHADEAVTVSDLAWYDGATGRFARVLKAGDQVLFANAYDGKYVYVASKGPDGALRVNREAVTGEFRASDNPADFLGIAAGIRGAVPREHYPPIQDVTTETFADGTPVRIYKLGFTDPWGKVETCFLFTINTDTDVIEEIECVVEGKTTRIHRRVTAETVQKPGLSWNLGELATSPAVSSAAVEASQATSIVTPQQMAERATSPVYVFAADPSWTQDRKIYDLPDGTNASARFFSATYRAKDGRDIVLSQGESFSRYFAAVFGKVQELGEQVPWTYESENGFKVLHQNDKKTEMWWTEFTLKTSGFEPHANRVGYILMSPVKTFLVLAINGPVSEQELDALVDSLIPADQYGQEPVQP